MKVFGNSFVFRRPDALSSLSRHTRWNSDRCQTTAAVAVSIRRWFGGYVCPALLQKNNNQDVATLRRVRGGGAGGRTGVTSVQTAPEHE